MTRLEWGVPDVPFNAWGALSSVVSTDDGVDFRLTISEQFPLYVADDRPLVIYDIHPEGTP